MEFTGLPIQKVFGASEVTVWTRDNMARLPTPTQTCLQTVIDGLGKASAKAQQLGAVITTYSKMFLTPDHKIYIYATGGVIGGMLKVGKKHLFVRNPRSQLVEMNPLCVLDFFVATTWQRRGIGHILMEYMLEDMQAEAWQLAYDRPSPKLIGFMRKHFGLANYRPQDNNFVVFDELFERGIPEKFADKRRSAVQAVVSQQRKSEPLIPNSPSLSIPSSSSDSGKDTLVISSAGLPTPSRVGSQRVPLGNITPPSDYRPAHLTSPFALFPDCMILSPYVPESARFICLFAWFSLVVPLLIVGYLAVREEGPRRRYR